MTRDRHRPPQLEALEGKQLLSTVPVTHATLGSNVVRQTSTVGVDETGPRPVQLPVTGSLLTHARISQGRAAAAAGRASLASTLRLNLVSHGQTSNSGNVAVSERLSLRAGLSSPVTRSVVLQRSVGSTAALGTARIVGGPSSMPLPTATVAAPVTTPATPTSMAQTTLSLPRNMR